MSDKIISRNCQSCKHYKIGIDCVCKDCTLNYSMPNYSKWEWNGIDVGCAFCNMKATYKSDCVTIRTSLFGKKKILIVETDNYKNIDDNDCCESEIIKSAFKINFCPECGRRL